LIICVIPALFSNFSVTEIIVAKNRVIRKQTLRDVEGSNHGLVTVAKPTFAWRDRENHLTPRRIAGLRTGFEHGTC
jgi:hypothetical protein